MATLTLDQAQKYISKYFPMKRAKINPIFLKVGRPNIDFSKSPHIDPTRVSDERLEATSFQFFVSVEDGINLMTGKPNKKKEVVHPHFLKSIGDHGRTHTYVELTTANADSRKGNRYSEEEILVGLLTSPHLNKSFTLEPYPEDMHLVNWEPGDEEKADDINKNLSVVNTPMIGHDMAISGESAKDDQANLHRSVGQHGVIPDAQEGSYPMAPGPGGKVAKVPGEAPVHKAERVRVGGKFVKKPLPEAEALA